MKLKSILCLLAAAFSVCAFAQPSLHFVANSASPGFVSPTEINVAGYTANDYAIFDLELRFNDAGTFRLAGWEGSIVWGSFIFYSPLENVGAANAPFELVTGVGGLPTSQILPADEAGQPTVTTGNNGRGTFRGGAVILNAEQRPDTGTLILGRWRLYPARFHDAVGNTRDVGTCISSEETVRFVANNVSTDRHIIAKEDATAASSTEVTFDDANLTVRLVNATTTRKKLDMDGDDRLTNGDLLPFLRCLFNVTCALTGDDQIQQMDANCDGSKDPGDLLPGVRRLTSSQTRANKNTVHYDLGAGAGTLVLQPAEAVGALFTTSLVPRNGAFGEVSISEEATNKGWNILATEQAGSDQLNITLFNLNGEQALPEVQVSYEAGENMSYYMANTKTFSDDNKPVRFDTSEVSFQTIQK